MAKQTKIRRAAAPAKGGIDTRDLWLAGLGAVSLTRKQGIKLYDTLHTEGKQFQSRVEQTLADLQQQARAGADSVRERLEAVVTPIRERAEATYEIVRSEVEIRLAPVLDKLGVKSAKPANVRSGRIAKHPVRKAGAKRVARKARAA
jgi:poly(hydroxyalkanoate) granule-associated protein